MFLNAIYRPKGEALEYANLGLNLYTGCSHECRYCYCEDFLWFDGTCNDLNSSLFIIERDLKRLALNGNRDRVHLSFAGDPYDQGRADNSYTRKVLELFNKYHHPFQILTKGSSNHAFLDFDLYSREDRFGVTLTFDNDVDSLKWEPGAALPSDRIKALKIAHDVYGIETWVSLEPVIIPEQTLHLIDLTHEFVDHYGVGKLNHNPELEKTIDWHKYLADAEALLKGYGKSYKIKKALAEAGRS